VAGFFRIISEWQIHEFKVLDAFGSGQQVVGEIVIDATVPATGARFRDEELHLWTFGTDGKVVRLRHYLDTAKHMRAAGVSVPA
jgi:ketosteroid isomerase-like protein